jgi:hypothetical protein
LEETLIMMKRLTGYLMIAVMFLGGIPLQVYAGVIGTDRAIAAEQHTQRVERLQQMLAREDVAHELVQRGVDPAAASERVAALTEEELAKVAGQIDSLPAGSGVVEVIGVVFVVLLVLELLGVTNVFTAI